LKPALPKAEKSPPAPSLHPNLAKIYRLKVAELEEELNDPTAESEAAQALRSQVDAVLPGHRAGASFLRDRHADRQRDDGLSEDLGRIRWRNPLWGAVSR